MTTNEDEKMIPLFCPFCNKPVKPITDIQFIMRHGDVWECENNHKTNDFAVKMYNKK
jgi:hypothetical protein